jgi:hypothetical protein
MIRLAALRLAAQQIARHDFFATDVTSSIDIKVTPG